MARRTDLSYLSAIESVHSFGRGDLVGGLVAQLNQPTETQITSPQITSYTHNTHVITVHVCPMYVHVYTFTVRVSTYMYVP